MAARHSGQLLSTPRLLRHSGIYRIRRTGAFLLATLETCKLYVPANSYAAYTEAEVWKNFKNIRAIGGDEYVEASIDGILYAIYDFTEPPLFSHLPTIRRDHSAESVTFNNKVYNVTEIQPRAFAALI